MIGFDYTSLWLGLGQHLWQTALVVGLIWLLDVSLRQAPARFHAALWWIALIKFLVPLPLLARYVPELRWELMGGAPSVRVTTALAGIRAVLEPGVLTAPEIGARASATAMVLTAAWLLVSAMLVGYVSRRVRRRAGRAAAAVRWSGLAGLTAAAARAGVPVGRIRVTDADLMPSLIGVLRSWILMPRRLCEQLSVDELCSVLVHEDAHRRHRDPFKNVVVVVTFCAFWFFPPMWLVARRLRHAAELRCDEAVLLAGVAPGTYARALARTVGFGLLQPVGLTAFAQKSSFDLAQRLRRIRQPRRFRAMTRHRVAVAAAVVLFAASMLPAVAGAGAPQSGKPDSAGSRPQWVRFELARLAPLVGAERSVSLDMPDRPLGRVLERLARAGGFELDLRGIDADTRVSLVVRNVTVAEALVTLGDTARLGYEVSVDGRELLVEHVATVGPVPAGGTIEAPKAVTTVAPQYPDEARRARIQGVVILEVRIGKDGSVERAVVLRSIDPSLDSAALEAVRQWRYSPTRFNGRLVKINLTVTVKYQLE